MYLWIGITQKKLMTITLFTTIAVLTALLAYQYSMLKTREADCERLKEHIASLETLLNEQKTSSDASAEVPASTETAPRTTNITTKASTPSWSSSCRSGTGNWEKNKAET